MPIKRDKRKKINGLMYTQWCLATTKNYIKNLQKYAKTKWKHTRIGEDKDEHGKIIYFVWVHGRKKK
jgi:hypothetical protein